MDLDHGSLGRDIYGQWVHQPVSHYTLFCIAMWICKKEFRFETDALFCMKYLVMGSDVDDLRETGYTKGVVSQIRCMLTFPTVLTLVMIAWSRIEYRTRQLFPWKNMLQNPMDAQASILLDYITPLSIPCLVKSLRAQHFPVAFAVLGGLLIKLLIVASTCLFSLQLVTILTETNGTSTILSLDSFDASRFRAELVGGLPALYAMSSLTSKSTFSGVFNQLPVAYQSIGAEGSPFTMISSTIDVFSPNIACRQVSAGTVSHTSCATDSIQSCESFTTIAIPEFCKRNFTLSVPDQATNETSQRFGLVRSIDCDGNSATSSTIVVLSGSISSSLDTTSLQNSIFIECSSSPAIKKATLALNASSTITRVDIHNANSRVLEGLDPGEFLKAVYRSTFVAANTLSRGRLAIPQNGSSPQTTSPSPSNLLSWPQALKIFQLSEIDPLLILAGYASRSSNFENATQLLSAVQSTSDLLGSHIAAQYLKFPNRRAIDGSVTRLLLNNITLRLMEALAVILFLLSFAIVFKAPIRATPRDLSTPGGLATVLTQSPRATYSLQDTVYMNNLQREVTFRDKRYATTIVEGDPDAFALLAITNDKEAASTIIVGGAENDGLPKSWWSPIPNPLLIALVFLPFGFVVTIELLHRRSTQHDGLSNAPPTGMVPFIISFLPGMLLTVFGGIMGLVDFYTKLLYPYHQLLKNPSPAQHSILRNYVSKLSIVAVMDAIISKHTAVVLTGLSTFLAPLLIIMVGALFVNAASAPHLIIGVKVLTQFNLSAPLQSNQTGIPIVAALSSTNTTSPPWIYGSFVFPRLQLPDGAIPSPPAKAKIVPPTSIPFTTTLASLQAKLNCTAVHSEDIKSFSLPPVSNSGTLISRRLAVPVPDGCGTPCRNDETVNTCDGKARWEGDALVQNYGGSGTMTAGSYFANTAYMVQNGTASSNSPICPQFSLIWGKNSNDDGNFIENIVAYNCYPFVTTQIANVTFNVMGWAVQNFTPIPGSDGTMLPDSSNAIIDPTRLLPTFIRENTTISPWIGYLIDSSMIPLSALAVNKNAQTIVDAAEKVYSRLAAQDLNLNRRVPSTNQPTINGTLTNPTLRRIKQDTTSTRVIEAIIGGIFILTAVSYCFIDLCKLLPSNPGSIAVLGSLIAHSEVTRREIVPSGSEWCTNNGLRKRKVFEGYLFSLGMWDVGMKSKRVFGIGIGKAKKVE